MYLNNISTSFLGKENIKNKIGLITYGFYSIDIQNGVDAAATVWIDMQSNSQVGFNLGYGSPKELGGGGIHLDRSRWKIDLYDALAIAIDFEGEDTINEYENPLIVILSTNSFWNVALYPKKVTDPSDLIGQVWSVDIDPTSGDIIYSE